MRIQTLIRKEFLDLARNSSALVPVVLVFVLFGLLIVFSQSSAVAPFIYTLF